MSDNHKDSEKPKGPKPLPLKHKKVRNPIGGAGKKGRLFPKAMQMYEQEYSYAAIARECGVHKDTVRRWLRDAGVPPKKHRWQANPRPWEDDPNYKPSANIFDANVEHKNRHALEAAAQGASEDEDARIRGLAAAQGSPAEQYQSYMASNAVKLMRDGLKIMRPPTNVREMEVLDKIARRHFGLDEKKASGANSLSIDINILNNEAAAAHKKTKAKAIDVDVTDSPNE